MGLSSGFPSSDEPMCVHSALARLAACRDRAAEPPRHLVPSSRFCTASTASSTHRFRACCISVPDLGFAGFRASAAVASGEASGSAGVLPTQHPSKAFPRRQPCPIAEAVPLVPFVPPPPRWASGFAPRFRTRRVHVGRFRSGDRRVGPGPVARPGLARLPWNRARSHVGSISSPEARPTRTADGGRTGPPLRGFPLTAGDARSNPGRARSRRAGSQDFRRHLAVRRPPCARNRVPPLRAGPSRSLRVPVRRSGSGRPPSPSRETTFRGGAGPADRASDRPSSAILASRTWPPHEAETGAGRLQGLAPPTSP